MPLTQEQINRAREQIGMPSRDSGASNPAYNSAVMNNAWAKYDAQQVEENEQSRFQETLGDIKQTGQAIKNRFISGADKIAEIQGARQQGQGLGSTVLQAVGTGAGVVSKSIGDLFTGIVKGTLSQEQEEVVKTKVAEVATNVLESPVVQPVIKEYVKAYQESSPETQRNLEGIFNIAMLGFDVAGGVGLKKGIQKSISLGKEGIEKGVESSIKISTDVAKRTFDTLKSVPERISNVRKTIGKTSKEVVGESTKKTTIKESVSFADNPTITGALDDIKIMVGLPESTPSVDLTFRAIKPRLTKKVDLKRVKAQMELANQSIVNNGFKPTNIREYADAVFQTKKKVWSQIQSKLDAGQALGLEVDLDSIGLKILDIAEDPALARINPNAVKQLTEIAENLTKTGGKVDILEAERIKQFLNAELSDAFGATDLSKQAKEAKKLITKEIGNQLDEKLATLPDEFRNLKIEYGSLSAIEDDILKRAIVFERANPEGLADILTKTQAAADIVFGGTKGRLQGIARLTIGKQLKKANDVNDLIKRAF